MKHAQQRWLLVSAVVLLSLLVVAIARGNHQQTTVRWVIGSSASALAQDDSKITVTGSGTFVLGELDEVTGGGTWETFDENGNSTGNGTYRVTSLVRFDEGPPFPPAGLALLRVAYDDGSRGVLVVSCHGPGSPDSMAEGIVASKGFVLYWNHIEAAAFFQLVE